MGIQAWAGTDTGRKRFHNEDAFLVDEALGLFIVADGLGGHAGGEVASRRCTEAIHAQVAEERPLLDAARNESSAEACERIEELVERAVHRACREIFALAEENPDKRGMATTCVLLLACGEKGVIGHVGDSRIYLQRGGATYQLTEDHSLVEELIRQGRITREQAESSPARSVITRAIGSQASVDVDTLVVDLLPGDVFLLCSDGVHGYLRDGELGPILEAETKVTLPERLINLANERGGRDNATAVVVAVPAAERKRELISADQKVEILRRIPLFQYMTYKELLALLAVARARQFVPHDVIVTEDEPGDELFIIIRGAVDVRRGGKEIAQLTAGGHFGEMALVDQAPRSATITATEPTSVITMGREALLKLMRRESLLAVKLLWAFSLVLSERLRTTNQAVVLLRDEVERLRAAAKVTPPFGEGP